MQLKTYQQATLDTLDAFFARALATGPADAFRSAVEEQEKLARLEGRKPEPKA